VRRLAFADHDIREVERQVRESVPLEDGAFFLVRGEETARGRRLVAARPYFPAPDEWERRGPSQLEPTTRLLSRAVGLAQAERAGLLFVHSHPLPGHPTSFSLADERALARMVTVMPDLLDGPFAAAVIGPDGWVAREYLNGEWLQIDRIVATGRSVRYLECADAGEISEMDDRQRRALGSTQSSLAATDVVVVGAGGLGSPLAETLYRMGVRRVVLIDPGLLNKLTGLRRNFGSKRREAARRPPPPKVAVLGNHLSDIDLGVEVVNVAKDVRDPSVLPYLLDADVISCTTDTHSSRAYLNSVAYAYQVPLIDGGVKVGTRLDGGLESLAAEIRVVTPGGPCLWCMNAISSETVRSENLPPGKRESLAREGYVMGTPEVEPSVAALTVAAAGHLAGALLGVLSGGDHLPYAYRVDVLSGLSVDLRAARQVNCICSRQEGFGRERMTA
jgi:molybdopterin/thiamine biosynthesis adenylyltransferase